MIEITNILSEFIATRDHTLNLCEPLEIEDYVVQPAKHVSPPKWHLAHTTWFFEELILKDHFPQYKEFNSNYTQLFNSYYKTIGHHWNQEERGVLSRPTVNEIKQYRQYVDREVQEILTNKDISQEVYDLIYIGIQHEKQHQELLLMDIKTILATNLDLPEYSRDLRSSKKSEKSFSELKEGVYDIGHRGPSFSYDNECPQHKTFINPVVISDRLVTNGEYLEFVNDKSYSNSKLWLSKGYDWLTEQSISSPLYWLKRQEDWYEYTLAGLKPLDLDASVAHISYFEAHAFAKWSGMRLPTEQELEVYFKQTSNIDSHELWNWTSSHYSPYPGFKEFDGALGEYNGKFMCNQFVLRGGCFASPKRHLRHTYRNFYEPQERWMFSGIRLAKDLV